MPTFRRRRKFRMDYVTAQVEVVPDVGAEVNGHGDKQIHGHMRARGKDARILIEDGDERWRARVLFHELAHLAKYVATQKARKPVRSEEAMVEALETHLFPILWEQGWRPKV